MDSWRAHMPKGMLLKSDGFASNISDPDGTFTLGKFCAERGIKYGDTVIPVRLDTFNAYGLAFVERLLPELEDKLVVSVERVSDGYLLRIDDGEEVMARKVVFAVGITHFEHIPDTLAHLPAEFLSHSARYSDFEPFKGRSVAVVGGGASALDWAGLLHDAGIDVQLIARQTALKFHGKPGGKQRSRWQRIKHPQTGLGPGWRSVLFADAPGLFHHLPESLRLKVVARVLGPSGGWFIRDKVVGQIPLWLGYTVERAEIKGGKIQLYLQAEDGSQKTIDAGHVIAATGYKVDLERLTFLSSEIRAKLDSVNGTPRLNSSFESSVTGLYFVGIAAANSFGPVMRFAYGADFAARTVAGALAKSLSLEPASPSVRSAATTAR
jgi:hypothetical protein